MGVVRRIIGEEPMLFQDMALLKPPRVGREKPWHQDHAYFDLELRTRVVGVWIALDPRDHRQRLHARQARIAPSGAGRALPAP